MQQIGVYHLRHVGFHGHAGQHHTALLHISLRQNLAHQDSLQQASAQSSTRQWHVTANHGSPMTPQSRAQFCNLVQLLQQLHEVARQMSQQLLEAEPRTETHI